MAAAFILFGTAAEAQDTCNTIQSGLVTAKDGVTVLTPGYDDFGYNYEAHMFNGPMACYTRDATACAGADPDHDLVMKWNDAWVSNQDCDGDGKLDRPANYKGSGAWCTNHESGIVFVEDSKGALKAKKWTYFVKIVAVPADAFLSDGSFFTSDGTLIGTAIWGAFAIVEEIYNDPSAGSHGRLHSDPVNPGLGNL